MFGSDVRRGSGNRVQHVVASIGARQTRACERHRLAIGHALVAKGSGPTCQADCVPADRTDQRPRQHRRRVIAVVLFIGRGETASDMQCSDVGGRRGDRIKHVVGSVAPSQRRACQRHVAQRRRAEVASSKDIGPRVGVVLERGTQIEPCK